MPDKDEVGEAVSAEVHARAKKLNDGIDGLAKALHAAMGCESLTLSATYQIVVEDSSKEQPTVQPVTCVGTSAVSAEEWKLHLAALHAVLVRLMEKQAKAEADAAPVPVPDGDQPPDPQVN